MSSLVGGVLRSLLLSVLVVSSTLAETPPLDPDELFDFRMEQLDFTTSSSSPSVIPDRKSVPTTYKSNRNAAGFMFDLRASRSSIVLYGLDINVVNSVYIKNGPSLNVLVYTKEGSFKNYETNGDAWKLWMNTTVISAGQDVPTSLPQSEGEEVIEHLLVPVKGRRAFYVSVQGPYLRYTDTIDKWYYQNSDVSIYADGSAKREGWEGSNISPRLFNGGIHYYRSEQVMSLNDGVQLLPNGIISDTPTLQPSKSPSASPMKAPTTSPTKSVEPTISMKPTLRPTNRPTNRPTDTPTSRPSKSPISFSTFTTKFEDANTKPVYVYAGTMFDIKARSQNIEINSIAFNTYLTTPLSFVSIYVRYDKSYKGSENDSKKWKLWGNVTNVQGQGMGNPTYLEKGSFEPILIKAQSILGIYITTDGPYIRLTKGSVEGKPHTVNEDLVLYEGVGKRYPIDSGTVAPRLFNGLFNYVTVQIPTSSPTIDTSNLWVANTTFNPVADTFIENGRSEVGTIGSKAQLLIDGTPQRVALLKFDIRQLKVNTLHAPNQILSVKLRLYGMSQSDFGGYVHLIPNGNINEATTTWDTVPYGSEETGTQVGQFRSIWPSKFYELDITEAFRNDDDVIPEVFLIRLSSDQSDGIAYRSRDGNSPNSPQLIVKFAYEPDTNKVLARLYGSDPPTMSPTIKPEWSNAIIQTNPRRSYFNYNPRNKYGPSEWHRASSDGYYDGLKRLRINTDSNRCSSGSRQSPQNVCDTNAECLEHHETRPRAGQYGLGPRNETIARPTPMIMHNKLRLKYAERFSEMEEPYPPGADFARNGFNSGVQDLTHIDVHVTSEHTICGKRYDAEMQQFYLHKEGNFEAIALLIEAKEGGDNEHFDKMLNFFQQKFDQDAMACDRKRRRARALFERSRISGSIRSNGGGDEDDQSSSKLRGGSINDHEPDEVLQDADYDTAASLSIGSAIYQTIHDRFLKLIQRRREASWERWDPLKPWDFYKSVHFWAYSGSLTEPPCSEGVNWRIVDVPMNISPTQLFRLKRLMFDHVDPNTCQLTSTHYEESNARPPQPYRGGGIHRCRRSDYASDVERAASGRVKGFVLEKKWWGVDDWPYVTPEFPNRG